MAAGEFDRCDDCGSIVVDADFHRRTKHRDETAFDGHCPMCEQSYDSYTTHLSNCPGGLRTDS